MHEIVSILEVTGTSPADNFKLWVTPVDSFIKIYLQNGSFHLHVCFR